MACIHTQKSCTMKTDLSWISVKTLALPLKVMKSQVSIFCFEDNLLRKKKNSFQQHPRFWTEYFGETHLRPQRMILHGSWIATDWSISGTRSWRCPGWTWCFRSELYIFESSHPLHPLPFWGCSWFLMKIGSPYFARHQSLHRTLKLSRSGLWLVFW